MVNNRYEYRHSTKKVFWDMTSQNYPSEGLFNSYLREMVIEPSLNVS